MKENMSNHEALKEINLAVELIDSGGEPEKKNFTLGYEESPQVRAASLKNALLKEFGNASATLESEEEVDETSYHLLGLDAKGKRRNFADEDEVDLTHYSQFQIYPRTMGGGCRKA
jgi:hypothetical protein